MKPRLLALLALSLGVGVLAAQTPSPTYNNSGAPWATGKRIQAEDFDQGGEGVAYHDLDSTNRGGGYRQEGVDLEAAYNGGYDIAYVDAGEWVQYTVSIPSSGPYTVRLRTARQPSASVPAQLYFGGVLKGTATVPSSNAWQNWTDVSVDVTLDAGVQALRVVAPQGGYNLDYLEVGNPAPIPVPTPVPTPFPAGDYVGFLGNCPAVAIQPINWEPTERRVQLQVEHSAGDLVLTVFEGQNVVFAGAAAPGGGPYHIGHVDQGATNHDLNFRWDKPLSAGQLHVEAKLGGATAICEIVP